jgi:hypothetical protein
MLASESLDRPLSVREKIAVSLHNVYCPGCRRLRWQFRLLRKLVRLRTAGRAREILTAGPELPPDVRERIADAIRSE